MKNTKSNIIASAIVLSALGYFAYDLLRTRIDTLARHAAGESDYEKYHPRKK